MHCTQSQILLRKNSAIEGRPLGRRCTIVLHCAVVVAAPCFRGLGDRLVAYVLRYTRVWGHRVCWRANPGPSFQWDGGSSPDIHGSLKGPLSAMLGACRSVRIKTILPRLGTGGTLERF